MSKVRHVLGISGGKDSAALAVYMKTKYPNLDIEYYTCDTGKELIETYEFINNLEIYLGKKIIRLDAFKGSNISPFDHKLKILSGFLPSPQNRWCTKSLKLDPFEKFVGNDPVISYVGIRGDEEREGYISTKSNIQSIFPFRKNIWSIDVLNLVLDNKNINLISKIFTETIQNSKLTDILEIVNTPKSNEYFFSKKLNSLLNLGISAFNKVVFEFLKTTNYPVSRLNNFELVYNADVLNREDIFKLLIDSGIGIPKYYNKVTFEVEGKKGDYARSRSGCYFCFFQQKIEWVWLYEQHPDLFQKAMEYEKDGYSWHQDEKLEDLIKPERINKIKLDAINNNKKSINNKKSPYLLDILEEAESIGCANCFI